MADARVPAAADSARGGVPHRPRPHNHEEPRGAPVDATASGAARELVTCEAPRINRVDFCSWSVPAAPLLDALTALAIELSGNATIERECRRYLRGEFTHPMLRGGSWPAQGGGAGAAGGTPRGAANSAAPPAPSTATQAGATAVAAAAAAAAAPNTSTTSSSVPSPLSGTRSSCRRGLTHIFTEQVLFCAMRRAAVAPSRLQTSMVGRPAGAARRRADYYHPQPCAS